MPDKIDIHAEKDVDNQPTLNATVVRNNAPALIFIQALQPEFPNSKLSWYTPCDS